MCLSSSALSHLAFTCFMWWFSCWERKCSDTDCLSTACFWLRGNLSLNMLKTRNQIPPTYSIGATAVCPHLRMFKHQGFYLGFVRPENCVSFSCICCRRRDLIWISWLQWWSTLWNFALSAQSEWPLGSRSRLLLKLFSKLFRFFSSPDSPGSLGWIPENLELSRDVLSSAVRPSTGCCVPTLHWIRHRWTSKTFQEKMEDANV